jgi:hypothetical protein
MRNDPLNKETDWEEFVEFVQEDQRLKGRNTQ